MAIQTATRAEATDAPAKPAICESGFLGGLIGKYVQITLTGWKALEGVFVGYDRWNLFLRCPSGLYLIPKHAVLLVKAATPKATDGAR